MSTEPETQIHPDEIDTDELDELEVDLDGESDIDEEVGFEDGRGSDEEFDLIEDADDDVKEA